MHKFDDDNATQAQQQKEPWDTNGDGKISLSEANNWYRKGKSQAITIDASLVYLNSFDTKG